MSEEEKDKERKDEELESKAPPAADLPEKAKEEPEVLLHEDVLERLEELSMTVKSRLALDFTDLNRFLLSTKRLVITNFLMGIARGVGFLLGATLVGTLAIYVMAKLFDQSMKALKKDVTLDKVISQAANIRSKFMNALEEKEEEDGQGEDNRGEGPPAEWIPPEKTPVPDGSPTPSASPQGTE